MRHIHHTRNGNQARVQVLALLLLGAFGLLSLDLAPVKAAMADYLGSMPVEEAVETTTASGPALNGRAPQMPTTAAAGCDHAIPAHPATMSQEVRDLIEKLAGEERRIVPSAQTVDPGRPSITSVVEARRRLGLSERQVEELKRIVADAGRDLADLRYVRNADGASWHRIVCAVSELDEMKDARRVLETIARLSDFVDTPLASTDETFRQARDRILDGYRDHARRLLTPTQQERFDRHDVQGVFDDSPFRSTLRRRPTFRVGTLQVHTASLGVIGHVRAY